MNDIHSTPPPESGKPSASAPVESATPPTDPAPHTDIVKRGWLELLPPVVRPYAYLARLDRPVGWWLLVLPCWWSVLMAGGGVFALNARDIWLLFLFWAGAVVMRAAGCVVNDLWDRKFDSQSGRASLRPLARGEIDTWRAFVFACALMGVGFLVLVQMSAVAILLGVLAIPLIVVYPLMKRVTWWPQAFLGVTFNLGALMAWGAVTGIIELPALLLYLGGVFWTLGYDTIYAHQDKEDDARIGVKSTALKFGQASRKWVKGFYGAAWTLILLAFLAGGAPVPALCLMLPAAAHLYWQARMWRIDDPASSLLVFRSNRDFGLLVLIATALF